MRIVLSAWSRHALRVNDSCLTMVAVKGGNWDAPPCQSTITPITSEHKRPRDDV